MILESAIQKQILDYIRRLGFYAWKNNNTGIFDPKRKVFRTVETKGVSDIIAIKNSLVLFIEVKTEKGVQSDSQKEFQAEIEKHGGIYILARSIEDVSEWLKNNNINTGRLF